MLKKMQAELPVNGFKAFKITWEQEYQGAEDAFEAEVGKMRIMIHQNAYLKTPNYFQTSHCIYTFICMYIHIFTYVYI
jgi:hypothetical protein